MNARIAWLGMSLAALLVGVMHGTLPASTVALRAADLLGVESSVVAARRGHAALTQALLVTELLAAAPWALLGCTIALALRANLRRWQLNTGCPGDASTTDAAGVLLQLHDAELQHVPTYDRLPLAPMPATQMPRGATELERQAFAALAAAATLPDKDQSGGTLEHRVRRRYHGITQQYGAGSLAAIGAATSDLGELLAYQCDAGQWTEVHSRPAHLALQAIAGLPAYWQLDADQRARIGALLHCLGTQQSPQQSDHDFGSALGALRAHRDDVAVVRQPAAQASQPDSAALRAALRELPVQLRTWNINARLRTDAPTDGWWLPDRGVLLLPMSRLRTWLLARLDECACVALQLERPTTGLHVADPYIAAALRDELLLTALPDVGSDSCRCWRVRVGHRTPVAVAALDGMRIAAGLRTRWGSPTRHLVLERA